MIRWLWSYALDALEHISDSYGAMFRITQSTSFIRMELCSVSYKAHLLSVWSYAPCVEVAGSTLVGGWPYRWWICFVSKSQRTRIIYRWKG